MLLVAEMTLFMLLILPLPFTMRRKVFTYGHPPLRSHNSAWFPAANGPISSFISESPIVAKVQYWLKITFVFILILFIDSVNRVYRVQVELAAATENTGASAYVPTYLGFLPHWMQGKEADEEKKH